MVIGVNGRQGISLASLVRFVAVGLTTAAIYAALIVALAEGAGLWPAASVAIAYVVAVAFNYIAHHRWTYCTDRPHRSSGPRYVLVIVPIFTVNVVATAMLPDLLGIGYGWVQLMLAAMFGAVTFVSQVIWVFSRVVAD